MSVPRWLPNAISSLRVLLVPVWLFVAETMVHTPAVAGEVPAVGSSTWAPAEVAAQ